MGRPLNKRNFKDAEGITVNFWDTEATVPANVTNGYIVKQTGSKTFVCGGGEEKEECKLVSKVPEAEGEMAIILESGVYVTKIAGRKLTASDGKTYTWSIKTDAADNKSGGYFNLDND